MSTPTQLAEAMDELSRQLAQREFTLHSGLVVNGEAVDVIVNPLSLDDEPGYYVPVTVFAPGISREYLWSTPVRIRRADNGELIAEGSLNDRGQVSFHNVEFEGTCKLEINWAGRRPFPYPEEWDCQDARRVGFSYDYLPERGRAAIKHLATCRECIPIVRESISGLVDPAAPLEEAIYKYRKLSSRRRRNYTARH